MLAERLRDSFTSFSDRPALWIEGQQFSYRQFETIAFRIQKAMSDLRRPRPIGIATTRSLSAYAGILGAVLDDRPYLPLNIDYPLGLLCKIVDSAGPAAIIISPHELDLGLALQSSAKMSLTLIVLDDDGQQLDLRPAAAMHEDDHACTLSTEAVDRTAYIMFTSGTTGEPKGIAISQTNLAAYLDGVEQLFDFREDDRFSQFFSLSFDLSVHDMFVAWTHGACLHVPSKAELMDPVGFVNRQELSVWFSVPSAASLAMRFRKLGPESLPSLRHALFCGEALSGEVAKAFSAAAPHAALTNLYGPTEATIAITSYCLPKLAPEHDQGSRPDATVVPVGQAFPGQEALVLRDDLTVANQGEVGELWLGGSQITNGYTNNPERTASKFRRFAHAGKVSEAWYATGDLVEEHPDLGLLYRGRKDDQIKLHGHRIELTEVEEALRAAAGTPLAIVTPWPPNVAGASERLAALVTMPHPPAAEILSRMAEKLAPFMMPSSIESVADMALNANGKLDRRGTIEKWIEQKN